MSDPSEQQPYVVATETLGQVSIGLWLHPHLVVSSCNKADVCIAGV